jgi:hypothetical protein
MQHFTTFVITKQFPCEAMNIIGNYNLFCLKYYDVGSMLGHLQRNLVWLNDIMKKICNEWRSKL